MSKKKHKESFMSKSVEDAALVSTLGGTNNSSAQERLAELLAARIGDEEKERREKKEQLEAFREAQIAAVTAVMEGKRQAQAQCPHMKPNFRPATGGQKDHRGVEHFLCQYCQKEYTGGELPYHLRIPAEMVGGPQ